MQETPFMPNLILKSMVVPALSYMNPFTWDLQNTVPIPAALASCAELLICVIFARLSIPAKKNILLNCKQQAVGCVTVRSPALPTPPLSLAVSQISPTLT